MTLPWQRNDTRSQTSAFQKWEISKKLLWEKSYNRRCNRHLLCTHLDIFITLLHLVICYSSTHFCLYTFIINKKTSKHSETHTDVFFPHWVCFFVKCKARCSKLWNVRHTTTFASEAHSYTSYVSYIPPDSVQTWHNATKAYKRCRAYELAYYGRRSTILPAEHR